MHKRKCYVYCISQCLTRNLKIRVKYNGRNLMQRLIDWVIEEVREKEQVRKPEIDIRRKALYHWKSKGPESSSGNEPLQTNQVRAGATEGTELLQEKQSKAEKMREISWPSRTPFQIFSQWTKSNCNLAAMGTWEIYLTIVKLPTAYSRVRKRLIKAHRATETRNGTNTLIKVSVRQSKGIKELINSRVKERKEQ